MSPWACSRVPGATMPPARVSSGHACEPQPGSAHPRHRAGNCPRMAALPRSHRAVTPPELLRGAVLWDGGSGRERSRDTARGSPGCGAGWSRPSWELSPLQELRAPGSGRSRLDPPAPAVRSCCDGERAEGQLCPRPKGLWGQRGSSDCPQCPQPQCCCCFWGHISLHLLSAFSPLLPPPGRAEPPGVGSGAWGARGVPAWQPRVGGGFWGVPWPGDPAAAPPAQAAPARGRLCLGARGSPQGKVCKGSTQKSHGNQRREGRRSPELQAMTGVHVLWHSQSSHRAVAAAKSLGIQGFAALQLRSERSRALQPPLVPWEEQGQGRTTWRCPGLVPLPSPPRRGTLRGCFSPSLPPRAASQNCSSVSVG